MMSRVGWKIAAGTAGAGTAVLTRSALKSAWRAAKRTEPPANPASPSTTWPEALTWAVSTGAALGVARLVAQRGAAAGWRKATGALPPGLEEVA